MNDSNPYEAPSTNSKSRPWRLIDFLVAGIWLAIPIGVFVSGRLFRPAFDDFGVDLGAAARYLLRPYSAIPFTIASVVVLFAMFRIPQGSMRRGFVWLACTTGGGDRRGIFFVASCPTVLDVAGPQVTPSRNEREQSSSIAKR
jgi:hypothetical protein